MFTLQTLYPTLATVNQKVNSWQNSWTIHDNSCLRISSSPSRKASSPASYTSRMRNTYLWKYRRRTTGNWSMIRWCWSRVRYYGMKILNNQVKFLTSQYIGTCKSAYTNGYALNWVLKASNGTIWEYIDRGKIQQV